MTRTGLSSKLQKHIIEPFVEMHPMDMQLRGLQSGDLATVSSQHGECVVRVCDQRGQTPGSVFMPIHWNDCFASNARVDKLVSAICDPVSGQPAFKQTPVSVSRLPVMWHASLISSHRLPLPETRYWNTRYLDGLYFTVLAGDQRVNVKNLMTLWTDSASRWAEVEDSHEESLRLIGRDDNGIKIWFAMQATAVPDVDEDWLIANWQQAGMSMRDLMLGRASGSQARAKGKLICTCHQVYDTTINAAIHEGCSSTAEIGKQTRAGTNCGSCIPELNKLLASAAVKQTGHPGSPNAKEESLC